MDAKIANLLTVNPTTGQYVQARKSSAQPVGKDNLGTDSSEPTSGGTVLSRRQPSSSSPETSSPRAASRSGRQQAGADHAIAPRLALRDGDEEISPTVQAAQASQVSPSPTPSDQPAGASFVQLLQTMLSASVATPLAPVAEDQPAAPADETAASPVGAPQGAPPPMAPWTPPGIVIARAVLGQISPATPAGKPQAAMFGTFTIPAVAQQSQGQLGAQAGTTQDSLPRMATVPTQAGQEAATTLLQPWNPAPASVQIQAMPPTSAPGQEAASVPVPGQVPAPVSIQAMPRILAKGQEAASVPVPGQVPAPVSTQASAPASAQGQVSPPISTESPAPVPTQGQEAAAVSAQASAPIAAERQVSVQPPVTPAAQAAALAAAPIPAVPPQQDSEAWPSSTESGPAAVRDTAVAGVRGAHRPTGVRTAVQVGYAATESAAVSPAARAARASSGRNAQGTAAGPESVDQGEVSSSSMAAGVSAFLRASGQPAAAPTSAPVVAGPPVAEPRAMLAEQVVSAVLSNRGDQSQQVTIRLDPPELGTIHLSLHTEKGIIRGVVQADNPETFKQLQREAPQLIERLVEGGIQVKQIDVQLNTNGGGTPSQGQSPGAGGWQQFADGRGQPGREGAMGPSIDASSDPSPQAAGTSVFTGDSVNLWL